MTFREGPRRHPLQAVKCRFEHIYLYETSSYFYLAGSDSTDSAFRMLKLDRRVVNPSFLAEILSEDPNSYDKDEFAEMLSMVNQGNSTTGGLKLVGRGCGVSGFVKFLDCYYLILITEREKVGSIYGNDIFTIKATEIFPIKPRADEGFNMLQRLWFKVNKKINDTSNNTVETRYLGLFQFCDVSKNCYFSYSYDLTHSLQRNYVQSIKELDESLDEERSYEEQVNAGSNALNRNSHSNRKKYNKTSSTTTSGSNNYRDNTDDSFSVLDQLQEMFIWNFYQVEEFSKLLGKSSASWVLPIVQGSYQQRRFDVLGGFLTLHLLARRSRHYAGTRYLKRGITVHGHVANDCEVEQIMQLDRNGSKLFCSAVQMRGSIPTYWSQQTSVADPRPPITIYRNDPEYQATKEHFRDLVRRYGAPVVILDLVKQREKKKRESEIGTDYRRACEVINSSVKLCDQLRYIAFDYSGVSKAAKKSKNASNLNIFSSNLKNKPFEEAVMTEFNLLKPSMADRFSDAPNAGKSLSSAGGIHSHNAASVSSSAVTVVVGATPLPPSPMLPVEADSKGGYTINTTTESNLQTQDECEGLGISEDTSEYLDALSDYSLYESAFFCNTTDHLDIIDNLQHTYMKDARKRGYIMQSGVLRTNCVDCLDRTNAAQFAFGKKFLTRGLQAFGMAPSGGGQRRGHRAKSSENTQDDYEQALQASSDRLLSRMIVELYSMYFDMGNHISTQYGGSNAHNKLSGGGGSEASAVDGNKNKAKITSKILTSVTRYYNNSFTDRLKQDAMNIYLGYYRPSSMRNLNIPDLWDLESDKDLHNLSIYPSDINSAIHRELFEDVAREFRNFLIFLKINKFNVTKILEHPNRHRYEELLKFFNLYDFQTSKFASKYAIFVKTFNDQDAPSCFDLRHSDERKSIQDISITTSGGGLMESDKSSSNVSSVASFLGADISFVHSIVDTVVASPSSATSQSSSQQGRLSPTFGGEAGRVGSVYKIHGGSFCGKEAGKSQNVVLSEFGEHIGGNGSIIVSKNVRKAPHNGDPDSFPSKLSIADASNDSTRLSVTSRSFEDSSSASSLSPLAIQARTDARIQNLLLQSEVRNNLKTILRNKYETAIQSWLVEAVNYYNSKNSLSIRPENAVSSHFVSWLKQSKIALPGGGVHLINVYGREAKEKVEDIGDCLPESLFNRTYSPRTITFFDEELASYDAPIQVFNLLETWGDEWAPAANTSSGLALASVPNFAAMMNALATSSLYPAEQPRLAADVDGERGLGQGGLNKELIANSFDPNNSSSSLTPHQLNPSIVNIPDPRASIVAVPIGRESMVASVVVVNRETLVHPYEGEGSRAGPVGQLNSEVAASDGGDSASNTASFTSSSSNGKGIGGPERKVAIFDNTPVGALTKPRSNSEAVPLATAIATYGSTSGGGGADALFQRFKALGIGGIAKSLIGGAFGLSGKDDSNANSDDIFNRDRSKSKSATSAVQYNAIGLDFETTKVASSSIKLYDYYTKVANNNLLLFGKQGAGLASEFLDADIERVCNRDDFAKREFQESIKEFDISDDDVTMMHQLSQNGFVTSVMDCDIFKGLSFSDSSGLFSVLKLGSVAYVEPLLINEVEALIYGVVSDQSILKELEKEKSSSGTKQDSTEIKEITNCFHVYPAGEYSFSLKSESLPSIRNHIRTKPEHFVHEPIKMKISKAYVSFGREDFNRDDELSVGDELGLRVDDDANYVEGRAEIDTEEEEDVREGRITPVTRSQSPDITKNVVLARTSANTELAVSLNKSRFKALLSSQQFGFGDSTSVQAKKNTKTKVSTPAAAYIRKPDYSNLVIENASVQHSLKVSPEVNSLIAKIDEYFSSVSMRGSSHLIDVHIHNLVKRYLYEKVVMTRELCYKRLTRRLANYSSERSILEYCSLFHKEELAIDLPTIAYIASDAYTSSQFMQLERLFTALKERVAYYQRKRQEIEDDQEDGDDFKSNVSNAYYRGEEQRQKSNLGRSSSSSETVFTAFGSEEEYMNLDVFNRSLCNLDYYGFVRLDPVLYGDMYAKVGNPLFMMNEAASFFFTKCMMNKK